ncbi:hypothetical protein [Caldiplasma sukawensis]
MRKALFNEFDRTSHSLNDFSPLGISTVFMTHNAAMKDIEIKNVRKGKNSYHSQTLINIG